MSKPRLVKTVLRPVYKPETPGKIYFEVVTHDVDDNFQITKREQLGYVELKTEPEAGELKEQE